MSNKNNMKKVQIGNVKNLSDLSSIEKIKKQVEQGELNTSQTLIEIAKEIASFFIEKSGIVFASVLINQVNHHFPVKDTKFEKLLRKTYYEIFGKTITKSALTEAVETIEAYQEFTLKTDRHETFVRVAGTRSSIYIDLNRSLGEVVIVDESGWSVSYNPLIKFRRPTTLWSLPIPHRNGSINDLAHFLNISDEDKVLLYSFIIGCFSPTGPYPILILQGAQGTGKSFISNLIKRIVDPSFAPIRSLPGSEQDLMISAQNSHLLAFDNLSGLTNSMSDSLCKLSTGGGFTTRKFYENTEEVIISALRPVILNGIDFIARRPDLADRSLIINLLPISKRQRKSQEDLMTEFETLLPGILGAVLDALSIAIREFNNVTLDSSPRMADFAKWATAGETGFGFKSGTFMKGYDLNQRRVAEEAVEHDLLISAIVDCLSTTKKISCSATELLAILKKFVPNDVQSSKWFPVPNQLKDAMTRIQPILSANGIKYQYVRSNGARIHTIELQ
ncbi:hypothetical protein [Ornithinibacillus contaminans]|uniref:hypothetical protein n=1 Tax=Ornithinibacillus contaminans TaxID=694055 RepID=UPI00064DB490|nr:hypothetical protein [Ornithinibacillus contaminans]